METLIDLGIIVFLPFMVYRGYRRGAVYTLMTFFTVYIAFSGAVLMSVNFSEPVGRLIQPIVKKEIVLALEDGLQFENVIIDKPVTTEEEENTSYFKPDYLTMSKALQVLSTSRMLSDWEGFVDAANDALYLRAGSFTGSVTDEISTVMGREMARVVILMITFNLIMAVWLLATRRFKMNFEGDAAKMNGYTGAVMGFMTGMLLVSAFAWITRDTIVPSSGVSRTVLYEIFAIYSPLEAIAANYTIQLDL